MVFILGVLGSIALILLGFSVSRKNVIFLNMFLAIVSILQYFLLDSLGAASFSFFVLIYGVLYNFENKFAFLKSKIYSAICYLVLAAIHLSFNGFTLSIEIIALTGSTLGLWIMSIKGNPLLRKWAMAAQTLTWITFQIIVGAYGMLIGNGLMTIAITISLVTLHSAKNRGEDLTKVKEPFEVLKNAFSRPTRAATPLPHQP